jgi:TonB-linked SusC/RagA family outer membrane protein
MNLPVPRQNMVGVRRITAGYQRLTRLFILFLLLGSLPLSAIAYAQTITISGKNISLVKVFKAIEQQAGYGIFYDVQSMSHAQPVNLEVRNAAVETVLNKALSNQPYTYTIRNKTIFITAKVPPAVDLTPAADTAIHVYGAVVDLKGQFLPGVTVIEKGSNGGTVTNESGEFKLRVKGKSGVLVFKYIGFQSQEAPVTAGNMKITLSEEKSDLSEVIVVGYGTQKKENLTGAVAAVSSKQIENRSVSNVSSSLAGLAPGVAVRQGNGRPGSDGATIRIRGTGTLNNNDALVLIDGIIGSIDAVNPNDIESISILKDAASASIYGSLAANGVILITTKKGRSGKPMLNYNSVLSMTRPSNLPTFVSDYVKHMQLYNEAAANIAQALPYSQNNIDLWTNANKDPSAVNEFGIPNYVAYPNTNWGKEIFENNIVQTHSLSVSGGSPTTTYNLSGRLFNNPGLMHNTGNKRYELRANLETKVADFLSLGTQTFASLEDLDRGNSDLVFNYLRQTTPGLYPMYNGKFGGPSSSDESAGLNNLLTYLYGNGGKNQVSRFNTTVYAKVNIWKNLKLESRINYQMRQQEQASYTVPIDRWNFAKNTIVVPAATPTELSTSFAFERGNTLTFDNVLRYGITLNKKHEINALAGHNEYSFKFNNMDATKKKLIDATVTTLGSASDMVSTNGDGYSYAYRSFFGRLNYAFDNKYLLEANVRYDGVSRFASENRWGTFPSFSAGWRLSQEPFMKEINHYVQDVKLRASWGQLGNSKIGNYDYMATYGGVNYSFNDAQVVGLARNKYANEALTWELTTQTDIGLDFRTLKDRMTVGLDYYSRYTNGILTTPPIYLTAGTTTAPTRNTAAVLNRGMEIAVNWNDQIGNVQYSIGGNFAYNYNVVKKYKGVLNEGWSVNASGSKVFKSNIGDVSSGGTERIIEGYGINTYYVRDLYKGDGSYFNQDGSVNINGGPASGMIRTEKDLAWVNAMKAAGYSFSPVNTVGKSQMYYGDFIYADKNGDGIYGNTYDQSLTGTRSEPKYIFGLNLGAAWKGIDISMIWSGMAGMQYYWNQEGYNNSTLRNGNAVSDRVANNHYYYNADNPSDPANHIDGALPRLKLNNDAINNTASNFWLMNANWVRLKNLQIGYTLPDALTERIKLKKVRIYFTGENLLTFTAFPGLDPELGANVGYPTMKQFAMGLNVNF